MKSPSLARARQDGFALLLMLVLLIAGTLYIVVSHLDESEMHANQGAATAAALTKARDALLGYAVTYRESHPNEGFGYFPCPDTDGDGIANTSCSSTTIGLLPYRTLGLPDLRDSSGNCLWYAVSTTFRNNPKTDPLSWDAQGDIVITNAGGTSILQAANDSRGGVAAVVLAPGAPLPGQESGKLDTGYPCHASPTQPGLYLESTASPFHSGPGTDATGAVTVNDQLLWLTSADVFARVRDRNDFTSYINAGITGIQSALSFALPSPEPDLAEPDPLKKKFGGAAVLLPATPPTSLSQSDQRFYLQWRDQFVYRKCPAATPYCYSLAGQQCDGVLLFGGEKIGSGGSQPRATTENTFDGHFESNLIAPANALEIASGSSTTLAKIFTKYASNPLATRAQDLTLCLSPSTQTLDTTVSGQTPSTTVYSQGAASPIVDFNSNSSLNNTPPIRLGQTGVSDTAYGCIWYPDPLQLGTGAAPIYLRSYFAFTVDTIGQGFTFTLADADSSINPTPSMCGKGGPYLGYAGFNGQTPLINYPKIGLEIDTHQDSTAPYALGDADAHHIAFVYWGSNASNNDDNTHGAYDPTTLLKNPPSGSAGYLNYPILVGTTYYVRFEMQRTYQANPDLTQPQVKNVLVAYITQAINSCPGFTDLTQNLANIIGVTPSTCDASVIQSISDTMYLYRNGSDGPAPMKQIWLGFTSGQDSPGQLIHIQSFKMQISQ